MGAERNKEGLADPLARAWGGDAGAGVVGMARNENITEKILTVKEACEFLRIGRTKLWELTKANKIPAYRIGRGKRSSLRYKRSELLRWLEQNRVG